MSFERPMSARRQEHVRTVLRAIEHTGVNHRVQQPGARGGIQVPQPRRLLRRELQARHLEVFRLGSTTDDIVKLRMANPGGGPHSVTGPIYVTGAEPGDTLEMLGPLGKPFEVDPRSRQLLLIAGGLGMAGVRALADPGVTQYLHPLRPDPGPP